MIQYILECIAFQLVFLVIYDFFLKKETFFQWNRAYLLGTHVLSLVLPWIKLEALRTETPVFQEYSEMLWNIQPSERVVVQEAEIGFTIPWYQVVFLLGVLVAFIWFGIKLVRLYQLRTKGSISYFKDFTQILVPKSHIAFSFFKSIFLGDNINGNEYKSIVSHELVHIKQWHSLDLLFFELFRIVTWFNPLVYIYQHRLTELHEFIADAKVPKGDRQAHCEMLLSQAFEVQHISFVNPFYKSSLIKKRIVMLQKSRSKKIWQLKYLVLVPIIVGMLVYTSCQREEKKEVIEDFISKEAVVVDQSTNPPTFTFTLEVKDLKDPDQKEVDEYNRLLDLLYEKDGRNYLIMKDRETGIRISVEKGAIANSEEIEGTSANTIKSKKDMDSDFVPFDIVDQVPVFQGCENSEDKRACFNEKIQRHISKNFHYPEEAQELGIQGRVSVMFTINEEGGIENIRKRGPHELLEAEVERIISRLPQMKPGRQNGEAVRVPFSIPIVFKLDDSSAKSIQANNKSDARFLAIPFAVVEEVPVFPGCEDAVDKRDCFNTKMQEHIAKSFRYPREAKEKGIQGKVGSLFTISNKGSVERIRTRGPHLLLEEETKRILESMPIMIPGKNEGKVVPVVYAIPVNFKLKDSNDNESNNASAQDYLQVSGGLTVENGNSVFKGKVMDSESMGIPGVNIFIVGADIAAVSDFDGFFSIKVLEGQTLEFQYKGLPTKKIKVAKESYGLSNNRPIKKAMVLAYIEYVEKDNDFDLLPLITDFPKDVGKTIGNYNAIVRERNRLLKSASKDNPLIMNLDEQLSFLKLEIQERLNQEIKRM